MNLNTAFAEWSYCVKIWRSSNSSSSSSSSNLFAWKSKMNTNQYENKEIHHANNSSIVSKSKLKVNSTWRRWPYSISVLSQYLGRRSFDFNQIWCADADFNSVLEKQNLNFSKFKMTDGSHLENIRNVITSRNIDWLARNLVCGRICLPSLEKNVKM